MRTMRAPLTLATTLAIAALWPKPLAAQNDLHTADLRPHFVEGRTATYQIWSLREQNQSVRVGPHKKDFDTRFEIEGRVTWSVKRVRPDGSAICSMEIIWMTAQLTGPGGEVLRSDSRKSHGKPEAIHGLLRSVSGVAVNVEVAPNGTVLSASGIDAIRRKAPQAVDIPDELDFMESATDLAVIAGAPQALALNKNWKQHFTWNHQLGKIDQSMRYTLDALEDIEGIPVATVTGVADVKLKPDLDRLLKGMQKGSRANARLIKGFVQTQIMFDLQRHEAIGRNTLESRRIEVGFHYEDQAITRTIDETIHSQALRLEEH